MADVLDRFKAILGAGAKWRTLTGASGGSAQATAEAKVIVSGQDVEEDVATESLPFAIMHLDNFTRRKIAEVVYQEEGEVSVRFKFAFPEDWTSLDDAMADVKADAEDILDQIVTTAASTGTVDFESIEWGDFVFSSDESDPLYITAVLRFSYPGARG